jgi:hypothetical protein
VKRGWLRRACGVIVHSCRGSGHAGRQPMQILAFAPLMLALSSCALLSAPLDPREASAVHSAEVFVARQGYTVSGHPPDQPVEDVELFDRFTNAATIVAMRQDTLQSRAYGIAQVEPGKYLVLFHRTHGAPGFRAVWVEGTEAITIVHATPSLKGLSVQRVPSNFHWSGP